MKRTVKIVLIITFAVHAGCTHTVVISDSEWEETTDKYASYWKDDPKEVMVRGDYIFHLADGTVIKPTMLARRDSTFVIYEIYRGGANTKLDDPLVVPLDRIESIEKITIWWGPTLTIIIPLVTIVVVGAILLWPEEGRPFFGT
jgi:hypothetical protein